MNLSEIRIQKFARYSHLQRQSLQEWVSFSWYAPLFISPCRRYNTYIPQAAKDVRADQDILVDIFERVENFFRRLEVYTNVPPTTEMMEMIVQIMVEVLSILGIAMKEIKQSRMSEQFTSTMPPLTE
jgi:hypothetical protein